MKKFRSTDCAVSAPNESDLVIELFNSILGKNNASITLK